MFVDQFKHYFGSFNLISALFFLKNCSLVHSGICTLWYSAYSGILYNLEFCTLWYSVLSGSLYALVYLSNINPDTTLSVFFLQTLIQRTGYTTHLFSRLAPASCSDNDFSWQKVLFFSTILLFTYSISGKSYSMLEELLLSSEFSWIVF